jgi:hypothetical protein
VGGYCLPAGRSRVRFAQRVWRGRDAGSFVFDDCGNLVNRFDRRELLCKRSLVWSGEILDGLVFGECGCVFERLVFIYGFCAG